jgi:hypothetical protein
MTPNTKTKAEIIRSNYAHFLESGAPYANARNVELPFLDRYKGFAPDLLLEHWRTKGLGLSHRGLLQFCDPEDHVFALDTVLGEDAELRPSESMVYAYTAFGELFVWNTRWLTLRIDLPLRRISPRYPITVPPEASKELTLSSALASISLDTYDMRDANGEPLFERTVQKLGPLAFGEVYGFFPALALGGAWEIGKLHRVRASEHFAILAQLGPFTIIDASGYPPRPLRTIG